MTHRKLDFPSSLLSVRNFAHNLRHIATRDDRIELRVRLGFRRMHHVDGED